MCVSGHFWPDPKETFARRVIMRAWANDVPCVSNVFMAEEVFKLEMLRIVLSELNEI